jgi:hypothetical protein
MSGFQIVVLIWLTSITATNLVLWQIVYGLASGRNKNPTKSRVDLADLNDPKNNPFLKAGIKAVKELKKEDGQNG